MNSSIPWWGSGLFTVAGTLIGALATLSLGLLNRHTERRRLSREQKVELYPELTRAANKLAQLPVWPIQAGNPQELFDEVDTIAQRVAFFGTAQVSNTITKLLTTAKNLADTITAIRTESRPSHRNTVDQRLTERHHTAVAELDTATAAFAAAGRKDLEIATPYTPVRPQPTGPSN